MVQWDISSRTHLNVWINRILVTPAHNALVSYLLLGVGDIPDAVYSIPWNHETRDSGLK
jgi:hypothetical protein